MTIIEEKNMKAEKKMQTEKLIKMLESVLPSRYVISEEYGYEVVIKEKKNFMFINVTIASLTLNSDDTINIKFDSEYDAEKIRSYLEDSTLKFKLTIDEEGYY